jgi:hypothetical protein
MPISISEVFVFLEKVDNLSATTTSPGYTIMNRSSVSSRWELMVRFTIVIGLIVVFYWSINAPTTYSRLCKMYLRWDRSYIKEEIKFARIVWKRPLRSRIIAIIDTSITNLRYPVNYAILTLLVSMSIHDPHTIIRLLFAI